MGVPAAAIEGLRGQRMGDGDQSHVRLLAKGEAQAKGAMGGQVADQRVRQRLAIILGFLVLGLQRGDMVPVLVMLAVLDDLAIAVDAHAVDDGFAILRSSGSGASSSGRMKPRSMRAVPSWFSTTNTPPRAISSGS